DDPDEDFRAVSVDADDAGLVQAWWLPYTVDGRSRKALPRLPRRTREGQGAARAPTRTGPPARRTRARQAEDPPPAPSLELEEADPGHPPRADRPVRDLGAVGLPVVPQRRRGRQQT